MHVFHFCTWTCSVQLSMLHMERHSRNTIIFIIIVIIMVQRDSAATGSDIPEIKFTFSLPIDIYKLSDYGKEEET